MTLERMPVQAEPHGEAWRLVTRQPAGTILATWCCGEDQHFVEWLAAEINHNISEGRRNNFHVLKYAKSLRDLSDDAIQTIRGIEENAQNTGIEWVWVRGWVRSILDKEKRNYMPIEKGKMTLKLNYQDKSSGDRQLWLLGFYGEELVLKAPVTEADMFNLISHTGNIYFNEEESINDCAGLETEVTFESGILGRIREVRYVDKIRNDDFNPKRGDEVSDEALENLRLIDDEASETGWIFANRDGWLEGRVEARFERWVEPTKEG